MAKFIWLKTRDGEVWKQPATHEGQVKWSYVARAMKVERLSLRVGEVAVQDDSLTIEDDSLTIEDSRTLLEEGEPNGKTKDSAILVVGKSLTGGPDSLTNDAMQCTDDEAASPSRKKRKKRKKRRMFGHTANLPIFTPKQLSKFNLSIVGHTIAKLYGDGYLEHQDVQNFHNYIQKVGPSANEVEEVATLLSQVYTDELKAELLKLRLGGIHLVQSLLVKNFYEDWKDDAGASGSGKSMMFSTLATFLYGT